MEYRKLCNTADELEGSRLLGILSEAGIPAYRMDSGSGNKIEKSAFESGQVGLSPFCRDYTELFPVV